MKVRNEVDRRVIGLPAEISVYRDPIYLAVAFETEDGVECTAPTPVIFPDDRGSLFAARYILVGHLCDRRAPLTVDGELKVRGQNILPERYVALWRDAIKAALSPEQFVAATAMVPVATITADAQQWTQASTSWDVRCKDLAAIRDAIATVPDLLALPAATQPRLQHIDDGLLQLTVPLMSVAHARIAYEALVMVHNYDAFRIAKSVDLVSAASMGIDPSTLPRPAMAGPSLQLI